VFIFSAKISLQVAIMLCIATILITTTSFAELSYAIEELLSPLKIIKAPVNEISMIISIALRFIPTLIEESARVLNAQASRGVDFSNGNFKDKIKSLTCLIIPMFSISFRKAEDLANSMAARGYDPRGVRTKFRHFEPTLKDLILILFSSFLLAMFIVLAVQNKYFSFFLFIDALV
jgi:energy-coupling factor transport system permease protein